MRTVKSPPRQHSADIGELRKGADRSELSGLVIASGRAGGESDLLPLLLPYTKPISTGALPARDPNAPAPQSAAIVSSPRQPSKQLLCDYPSWNLGPSPGACSSPPELSASGATPGAGGYQRINHRTIQIQRDHTRSRAAPFPYILAPHSRRRSALLKSAPCSGRRRGVMGQLPCSPEQRSRRENLATSRLVRNTQRSRYTPLLCVELGGPG